jgi:hypothetical protein
VLFENNNIIFLHIPKTGGNSIQDALRNYSQDKIVVRNSWQDGFERFSVESEKYEKLTKHSNLNDYFGALGDNFFKYRVFTVIRNPFDRLVSFYFSPHRGKVDFNASDFEAFIIKIPSLEGHICIKRATNKTPELYKNITFMRFENLGSDFAKLCTELGIKKIDLPHRNRSNRPDYRECYNTNLRKWVEKTHKLEFSIGRYHF